MTATQVKNYSLVAASVETHVFAVLRAHGYRYDIFAHTYNQTAFANPRNREPLLPIQPTSLQRVLALPAAAVLYDPPAAADAAVDLDALARNGDPWPDNPRRSILYFARQLHSLHRVTSLWLPRAAAYALVLYLRPDARFLTDIDLPALAPHLSAPAAPARIATPYWARNGGLNDRLAFGPPGAMAAYGRRGDALRAYVAAGRRPHAETFLRDFLRERGVEDVPSACVFQRVRVAGDVERGDLPLAPRGPGQGPSPGGPPAPSR
jgi:hypothetical protein